jgi:hypothetical protein
VSGRTCFIVVVVWKGGHQGNAAECSVCVLKRVVDCGFTEVDLGRMLRVAISLKLGIVPERCVAVGVVNDKGSREYCT